MNKYLIKVFLNPRCWIRNDRTDKIWGDALVKDIKKGHHFCNIDEHSAELNGKLIWISNHPYGSFTNYKYNRSEMPTRAQVEFLHEKLMEDMV